MPRAKSSDKQENRSQITIAIIGAIATVIVSLIGILPNILKTPVENAAQTITATPTPGLQRVSIKGKVLRIDLPDWAADPVRGSITFNKNDAIASSGKLMVYLTVRDEQGIHWKDSEPEFLLALQSGEKLCNIVPAEFNTTNYWLGFQSHCASGNACSYNIEGRRLWATINEVEVVIASQGVQCPDR